MEFDQPEPAAPFMPETRLRPCWVSTMALKPYMVLAKSVSAASGGYATMSLPAGATLAEETIGQMIVKGIECVAVLNTEPMSEADYALATQSYEARLGQIFGPERTEHCQALLDALLRRGPMPC